nr:unnamed protein product [Callosobruchus analis]
MDVHRLLGDEIEYELYIRNLPVYRTVAENRSTLRGALERQGSGAPIVNDVRLNPESEYDICRKKLIDLRQDIIGFDRSNRSNEYKRITTRLGHVLARLRRSPKSEESLEHNRSELIGHCMQLIDQVETINEEIAPQSSKTIQPLLLDSVNESDCSLLDEPVPLMPQPSQTDRTVNDELPTRCVEESHTSRPTLADVAREVEEEILEMRRQLRNEHQLSLEALDEDRRTRRNDAPMIDMVRPSIPPKASGTSTEIPVSRRFIPREDQHLLSTTTSGHSEFQMPHTPTQPYRYEPEVVRYPGSDPRTLPFHQPNPILNTPHQTTCLVRDDPLASSQPTTGQYRSNYQPVTCSLGTEFPQMVNMSETRRYNDPSQQVFRWKLLFDGQTSVTSFLERLHELQLSRNVSDEVLLRSALELFSKDALLWYRTRQFKSWSDLESRLKADFLPY